MAFTDNVTVITAAWLNGIDNITTAFTSSEQAITAAGQLVLAHSLASAPQIVQIQLICKTTDLNYAVDDVVINDLSASTSTDGISVVIDSTNITLRFASGTSSFVLLNKTTGSAASITNASWKLIVKAWTMQ